MRQVPRFLFIGNGRLARHFKHYFSLLAISFDTWKRTNSLNDLQKKAKHASHILLMIHDDAIEHFIGNFLSHLTNCLLIHFSGRLVSAHAIGAHPLMTFNHTLYDLPTYQAIPFLLDHDAPSFEEILPGLPNRYARLHSSFKAKYHALCVLSGNFSCLLWDKLLTSFQDEFNLPIELAYPYLTQQMKNIIADRTTALTGPLVRDDQQTLANNLLALENDPFQEVYKSFVTCYQKTK